jgi:hypothetical protein
MQLVVSIIHLLVQSRRDKCIDAINHDSSVKGWEFEILNEPAGCKEVGIPPDGQKGKKGKEKGKTLTLVI